MNCLYFSLSLAISNISPRSTRDNLDVIDFCFSFCFHKPPCTEEPLFYCRTQWRNALERKSDWFRLIELSKYYNFGVAFYMSHSIVFFFGHAKIKRKIRKKKSKIDWIHYSTLHPSEMTETLWHSGISSIYCAESVENRRNKK